MLRIYVGNNELIIAGKKDAKRITRKFKRNYLLPIIFEVEQKSELKSIIEQVEHTVNVQTFLVTGRSFKKLIKDFLSYYQIVEAAGGIILSEEGKVLMMFRKGKWDLPKGKIDSGETVKQAARREVIEETGILEVKIGKRIKFHNDNQDCTFHSYWLNGKRMMKVTHWFRMKSSDKHPLTPQLEEGITEVGWYGVKQIQRNLENSYRSVRWVLEEFFGKHFKPEPSAAQKTK